MPCLRLFIHCSNTAGASLWLFIHCSNTADASLWLFNSLFAHGRYLVSGGSIHCSTTTDALSQTVQFIVSIRQMSRSSQAVQFIVLTRQMPRLRLFSSLFQNGRCLASGGSIHCTNTADASSQAVHFIVPTRQMPRLRLLWSHCFNTADAWSLAV